MAISKKEIVDLKSAVERLTLSQNQTEKRIDELIQAQKRTEEELKPSPKPRENLNRDFREWS